jgi:hypothetical protein
MAHRVGDGLAPALVEHGALDGVLIAHCALVETARHTGIGQRAGLAHRGRELRMGGDPVVDGARRHVEEFRQGRIGGAQQAIVARQFAKVAAVKRGTSDRAHGDEL